MLAVFQALGVAPTSSMVFGESVLNDAVAIVLVHTLLSFNHPYARFDAATSSPPLRSSSIFVGSMLLGGAYGVLSALTFKRLDLRAAPSEATLLLEGVLAFAFPWAAFYSAEALRLSGIVTILFCGIFMSQYTRHNFSDEAATLTTRTFKLIAKAAERTSSSISGWPSSRSRSSARCGSCRSSPCSLPRRPPAHLPRLVAHQPLARAGRRPATDLAQYKFVMWFSGLRGGVAFASPPSPSATRTSRALRRRPPRTRTAGGALHRPVDDRLARGTETTLLVAVFTIFAFGGAITDVSLRLSILSDRRRRPRALASGEAPLAGGHSPRRLRRRRCRRKAAAASPGAAATAAAGQLGRL